MSKRKVTHIMGGSHGFVGFQRNFRFFGLLRALRVSGNRNLLTEALVTLGATSRAGGSSSTAGGIEGVPVAAFDGSSSSLHEAKKL
jgi:hypothetical protein